MKIIWEHQRKTVASGGDQLTHEQQAAAKRHIMDGNTPEERLELLEPQTENWHCMVCMLKVSTYTEQITLDGIHWRR